MGDEAREVDEGRYLCWWWKGRREEGTDEGTLLSDADDPGCLLQSEGTFLREGTFLKEDEEEGGVGSTRPFDEPFRGGVTPIGVPLLE